MASTGLTDTAPRVLHVISGLEVGGAEMAMYRLASRMAETGAAVMVASLLGGGGVEDALLDSQIDVVSLRRKLPARAAVTDGVLGLAARCRTFRPQLLVGWMYHGIAFAHLLRPFVAPSAAVLWNVRCTLDESQTLPAATRALIRALALASPLPAGIVYNSRLGRTQHAAAGFCERRACVIANGVDVEAWRPDRAAGMRVREELGIGPDDVVIGHVARLHPMKGQLDLLAAAASSRFPGGVVLLMVGRGVTADSAEIAPALSRLSPGVRVVMPGERSDIPAIMNAMDVFCLSSTSEGFPNVVVEAMACGVPCVVTDVGDAPVIVDASGWTVPRGVPDDLAAALAAAVALDAEERSRRGQLARQRAVELYSIGRMAADYSQLFSRVAS